MPLMKCGCVAMGRKADGSPVCPMHFGILPGAEEVAPAPSLEGRMAQCAYCKSKCPSNLTLPFFEFGAISAGETTDRFYCGCRGWD